MWAIESIVLHIFYFLLLYANFNFHKLQVFWKFPTYSRQWKKVSCCRIVEAIEVETEIARHGGKSWSQRETAKLREKCQHIFDVKIVIACKERERHQPSPLVGIPLRFLSVPFRRSSKPDQAQVRAVACYYLILQSATLTSGCTLKTLCLGKLSAFSHINNKNERISIVNNKPSYQQCIHSYILILNYKDKFLNNRFLLKFIIFFFYEIKERKTEDRDIYLRSKTQIVGLLNIRCWCDK